MTERGAIVLFDLDGTLTKTDSFLSYLITFGKRHRCLGAFAKMPFRLTSYLAKMVPDYKLKQSLIRDFLSPFSLATVALHTDWFCKSWLPKQLHPVGLHLLEQHLAMGDRVILLSASPDVFVPSIAHAFGIKETICTKIETNSDHWTGKILGKNCKGIHKLASIRDYLGCEIAPGNSFAYGDSPSDGYVLEWVTYGAWMKKSRFEPLNSNKRRDFPN